MFSDKQTSSSRGRSYGIFEDNLPGPCYPRGMVIEVSESRDDNVRKVTVKTIRSIYKISVSKIAVIDIYKSSVAADDEQHEGGGMLRRYPEPTDSQTA